MNVLFWILQLSLSILETSTTTTTTTKTYNKILFPGTHNSYCNLNNSSPKPASSFKSEILNQQWSITEQLDKGIRVLDIELNSVTKCPSITKNCTFIVSHGSQDEVEYLHLGYSFLDDILMDIKNWHNKSSNSFNPITIILNKQDSKIQNQDIYKIFNQTKTDQLVYLYDTIVTSEFNKWPTINQMQEVNKPLMIFGLNTERKVIHYQNWYITSSCNQYNKQHNIPMPYPNPHSKKQICINQGWDGINPNNFSPDKLVITDINTCKTSGCLFILNVLCSPRNILENFPFIFGGNPHTQPQVNTIDIILNLTIAANKLLSKNNQQVNWIQVDFFDTLYEHNQWTSNPHDGLLKTVEIINNHNLTTTSPPPHQSSKSSL
jgi:hypothetical protein